MPPPGQGIGSLVPRIDFDGFVQQRGYPMGSTEVQTNIAPVHELDGILRLWSGVQANRPRRRRADRPDAPSQRVAQTTQSSGPLARG